MQNVQSQLLLRGISSLGSAPFFQMLTLNRSKYGFRTEGINNHHPILKVVSVVYASIWSYSQESVIDDF